MGVRSDEEEGVGVGVGVGGKDRPAGTDLNPNRQKVRVSFGASCLVAEGRRCCECILLVFRRFDRLEEEEEEVSAFCQVEEGCELSPKATLY